MNKIKTIVLFVLTAILLVACSNKDTVESIEQSTVEEETTNEGEIVLAAPRDLAPGPTDAFYTSVILYVWEPLIAAGEDGKPVGKLAESWEMSDDGKEWTFTLRDGVTFHDGEKLNADAVIANFDRWRQVSPKSSPFYGMDIDISYPTLKEVVKVDELTFKLIFGEPQPTLLYSMVNFSSPIYSPNNFDENGDFNGLPQGTGPFKLIEHEKDSYVLLEANEHYYGEKAKAERIRINVIPDPDTRVAALKAGEIYGVIDLGAIPPEYAEELLKDDRFEASTARSSISHYIHPNGASGMFSDVRLRQAVSLAVDRELIVEELYRGYPTATTNILNNTSPFYKEFEIKHDVEKAKQLVKEVLGEEGGEALLIVPSYGIDRYPYKAQAELIQYQLKEIGIDVEIQILDTAAFHEARANGEFDLALATQGLPNAEPYTILNEFMHRDGGRNKSNSLGYENPYVEQLLDEAASELDVEKRADIYFELQQIAIEELPTIPLFHDVNLIVYNRAITGLEALVYGATLHEVEWAD